MSRFGIQQPSGDANVLTLLTMLSNPTELKERLEQLRAQEKSLDEKIALVGEVDKIAYLREEAEKATKEALELSERTKEEAKLYMDKVRSEASAVLNDANKVLADSQAIKQKQQAEIDAHKQQCRDELAKERTTFSYECQEQDAVLNEKRLTLEAMNQDLHNHSAQLAQLQKELTEQENVLKMKEKNLERFQKDVSAWHSDLQKMSEALAKEIARIAR